VRFVVAFLVMAGAAHLLHRREGGTRPPVWMNAVMGVLNFGVTYGIVYWTETILPSGLVCVLWAVFPMMMAFSGHFWLPGERLRPANWAGFVLGFVGVVVLFFTDVETFGAGAIPAALILLLSPTAGAVSNTLVKRYGQDVSSVLLNRNGMFIGAALLLGLAALTERGAEIRWTGFALFSIGYLAIVGTVVTFGIYFWLLRYSPAHHLSLIAYVTPVVALLLGWIVRGETMGPDSLAGTGLILVGVYLVMGRPRRKARTSLTVLDHDLER